MKRLFLILIVLIGASCSLKAKPANLNDQREALRLVDQGTSFLRKGQIDNAHASYTVASQLYNLAAAYDGLGCVAIWRKDYKLAEDYFWKAYNMDKNYNNSLSNLAILYQITGFTAEAKEMYERAMQEDPANFKARNNYAVLLSASANKIDQKKARTELMQAKALAAHPLISNNLEILEEVK